MSEFIGSRISLVSKADIRYVGTLHEINSEKSTVALENVSSFGTEGRKTTSGQPDEEVPPSDSVYEYIVFRGSDVKDLRIEEAPAPVKESKPLNDPAIVDTSSRPAPSQPQGPPPRQNPNQNQQHQGPIPGQQQGPPPGVPPFGQYPPPPFYPPPQGWGRGGPPGPGFPGMPPYGAPPGWFPPPGQGFPQGPGPFPPYGYPPPTQQFMPGQGPKPSPIGPGANKQQAPRGPADKPVENKDSTPPAAELASASTQKAPTPPIESKPSSSEIAAAVAQPSAPQSAASTATAWAAPTGPKNGRVQPALPLQPPAANKAPLEAKSGNVAPQQTTSAPNLKDATQAATAAVAAAMAKLPNANGSAVDHLAKKVNDMRVNDQTIRAPRQPGPGGFNAGQRGRGRGAARGTEARKVDVPATDFDFESSNAKFNKQDLVKEAIAGSPLGEAPPIPDAVEEKPEVPVGGYNKSTSFFDNISSESKDRAEASGGRPGGREWRGEEQKKNLETFGQGSVDNGYRGGYRGRGRGRGGRGRGYSGNGQPGYRGRGGYRGGRGDSQAVEL
ncbi:hypothetical protein PVAG01_07746 [Phlyctema vagabunda]|uniref:Uncharacterized protein n=1 Tax=Phlyctema vagabunda TaxID=108571 RepID=A0ABR4PDA8_9HELO